MSYKTILVHVDETKQAIERIRIAVNLAISEEAHLIGSATTGLSKFLFRDGKYNAKDFFLASHLEFLRDRAQRGMAEFEPMASKLGLDSIEQRIIDDEASSAICLQARYCDLVVIGQNDWDQASPAVTRDFPENVILNCIRPVLVIPYAGQFKTVGKKVLISWDASEQATRAVSLALPLLKRADIVNIVVFDPDIDSERHGQEPGADIALFLARHGIKVNVKIHHTEKKMLGTSSIDIGNALLSLTNDLASDLLVMGAYGHSRFRETVLGGVTRTVLDTMTLPVLMAH